MAVDLDLVRELVKRLPEVEEGTWYGAPAFRVNRKVFVRVHENDADLLLLKVGGGERDALVASDPTRYSVTNHRPERDDSVLLRFSAAPIDRAELAEQVEEAWRHVAPRRLLDAFDRRDGGA